LEFAERIVRQKKPDLLVLDEINLALYCNLLNVKEVVDFLDRLPKSTDAVLTGRYAPDELLERADFVNEVKDVKSPKEMVMTKGIQY